MTIQPISLDLINKTSEITPTAKSVSSGVEDVGNSFESILSSLNESQANADNLVNQLALGDNVDLHTVMIGLEENDINFKVAMSIRDKLVNAYQQIMQMQV
jgi:flagellar hook-basal body complex protein FliE